jgi:DNA-directed RNA polymerase specialized sigma24 family protein
MNSAVSAYREAVEAVAERMARTAGAIQVGAEYDDLVQEGLINVWQTLERGIDPSTEHIENRMRDWIRHVGSQVGKTRDSNIPYEALLPLDDFRVLQAAV